MNVDAEKQGKHWDNYNASTQASKWTEKTGSKRADIYKNGKNNIIQIFPVGELQSKFIELYKTVKLLK